MKFSSIPLLASLLCASLLPCSALAKSASHTVTIPGIYELSTALDLDFLIDVRTCTQNTDTENAEDTLQLFTTQDVNQQRFYIDQLSTGKYRISSLNSGRYISSGMSDANSDTDASPETASDASPSLVDFDAAKSENAVTSLNWAIQDAGDGYVYLSCNHRYLTAGDDRAYLGGSLSLEPFTGETNQKWLLRRSRISSRANADTDFFNPYEEDGKYADLRLSIRASLQPPAAARLRSLKGISAGSWTKKK